MGYNTVRMMQEDKRRLLKRHVADQKRYFVAHLDGGVQLYEHTCRWVDVPIGRIVMLELHMGNRRYCLERRHLPNFVEFVHFKTAVCSLKPNSSETLSRCIGWHDGSREYILRADEKTGEQAMDTNDTPGEYGGIIYSHIGSPPQHLHPQSKIYLKPISVLRG